MNITRLLGATALVGSLFVAPAVWAQAAPNVSNPTTGTEATQETTTAEEDQQVSADGEERGGNEVIVTGSRIPRPETDGVLPGVQVDSTQIVARGFTNAIEILNDIPLVGPGASPLGNNGGQAASLGAGFADLLDLGTSRTLTLVNNRRFVSGNAASLFVADNSTGSQVDVNGIPASLIQRVDVLTVGGAAAYGSDAIAGVINFILKDNFEGLEIGGLAGVTTRGDAGQQQLRALAGRNFMDDRGNVTLSFEYNHNDGLQADSRDFRLRRASTLVNGNFLNGGVRNPAFGSAIIDVQNTNNGAFLRATDDGQPATSVGEGLVNQTLSFNGTILNTLAAPPAYYTPLTQSIGGAVATSNFIAFRNGLGAVGQNFAGNTLAGTPTTVTGPTNQLFFNTGVQLVQGAPGSTLIGGTGLNGRATPIAGLPITTFAPTALPAGVTAAQVFTQFGVTPPAGATTAQSTALAINVLQANRPTAREFFAANPNVNVNAFIGTFIPGVPRVANTDTTPVSVRSNQGGGTVQVPLNQVLPFLAVPLEFTEGGQVRPYTAASITPTTQATIAQAPGSDGGFLRSIENIVLRVQQDRYIGNFLGKFDLTDEVTFFTENQYARTKSVALQNSPSQNFLSTGAENAGLVVNVDNPFLDASDRTALNAVGINAATRGGTFVVTRQNQDIFGDNPVSNDAETYRFVGGARSNFNLLGQRWNAEVSATYGRAKQKTRTTQINDIEYQLALDAVDQGLATTGVANGNIVCRSQLFPAQYLGRTPIGTVANLTRQPGADGLPTEVLFTPTITQAQINACAPLNPFGYNQMSEASKQYVRQDNLFTNVGEQIFLQGTFGGGLFELPGGLVSFAAAAEYRKEKLDFRTDALNQLGRGRSAPSAQTRGQIEAYEVGGEARIPIFGGDFGLGELEFNPAVRVSKQDGSSAAFRNLAGQVVRPESKGDAATIYSLAGNFRPIPDITIRGNYTKSIRQPSVVELFLGGQPAFAAPTDPCGPAQITGGASAERRRANCRAAVISQGIAADATTADAFLATFLPNAAALPGSFSGAAGLSPERGTSWTAGAVLAPRFAPGFSLSADYINLNLRNIIQPTNLAQALQFCYDSATFPDTGPQTGANTCGFFTRNAADFQVAPGFASGFINLSAVKLRAVNISGRYSFELPQNLGQFTIRGNGYHLIRFEESAAGNFTDGLETAGTFTRPQWEAQLSGRYEKGAFYTQLTYNFDAKTKLFTNGAPSTIENFPDIRFDSVNLFDLTVGADLNDRFRLQATVINLTDKNYAGSNGLAQGAFVDQIGRRIQISTNLRF
ncbi:TonB-dependent receptor domain-containing protein [uncultured Sphingomonas sp.]|uniref:TonB-dependent receptor domain-containing protein n=1 Tax=uncultured Sphingomonas sp. TaxID=158754 RepID=UPI0035C95763